MKKETENNLNNMILNHVLKVMKECEWNRTRAAKELGVAIRTVSNYLRKLEARGVQVLRYSPTTGNLYERSPVNGSLIFRDVEELSRSLRSDIGKRYFVDFNSIEKIANDTGVEKVIVRSIIQETCRETRACRMTISNEERLRYRDEMLNRNSL